MAMFVTEGGRCINYGCDWTVAEYYKTGRQTKQSITGSRLCSGLHRWMQMNWTTWQNFAKRSSVGIAHFIYTRISFTQLIFCLSIERCVHGCRRQPFIKQQWMVYSAYDAHVQVIAMSYSSCQTDRNPLLLDFDPPHISLWLGAL